MNRPMPDDGRQLRDRTQSRHREAEAFDKIVAALSADEAPPRTGRPTGPARVLLAAAVLVVLGWLVMNLGWPGALIACGIGAGMLEIALRRRNRRKQRPDQVRRPGPGRRAASRSGS